MWICLYDFVGLHYTYFAFDAWFVILLCVVRFDANIVFCCGDYVLDCYFGFLFDGWFAYLVGVCFAFGFGSWFHSVGLFTLV